MTSAESPTPTPKPEAGDSALGRLLGVFVSPVRTFAAIAARPTWVLPMAVGACLSLPLSELVLSRMDWRGIMTRRMAGRPNPLTEAQMDGMVEQMRRLSWMWDLIAVLAPLLVTLLIALVLWGACQAFGWEVRFPQSLGVTAHAFFPTALASVGLLIALWNRDTIDPDSIGDVLHTNLGFLVDYRTEKALHALLASVDLFALWSAVLIVLGLSAAAKAPRRRVAILVATLWILFVLGKVGIAAFKS